MPKHVFATWFKGFAFDYQAVIDKQIDAKVFCKFIPLVSNYNGNFSLYRMASHNEFTHETLLVNRLKQSNAKVLLYFDGGIDGHLGERRGFEIELVHNFDNLTFEIH